MPKIDASELRSFAADLTRASGRAGILADKAVRATAASIVSDAKRNHTFQNQTGNLENSIGFDATKDTGGTTAVAGPTAAYGAFVEYGTSRSRPHPFMGPAFDRQLPALEQAMAKIVEL